MSRLRRRGDPVALAASIAIIFVGVALTVFGAEQARCVASRDCDATDPTLRMLWLAMGVLSLAAGSSWFLVSLWRWT